MTDKDFVPAALEKARAKRARQAVKRLKAKADKLCGDIVRARGKCERCGTSADVLQWAHIRKRRYNATRCDPANAWCLCRGCHHLTEHDVGEFMLLIDATIGRPAYDELRLRSRVTTPGTKAFWEAQIELLQHAATVPYARAVRAED